MAQSSWSILFRTILGFLVAPLLAIILVVAIPAIFYFSQADALRNFYSGIWLIKFFGMFAYPIALVLGLPLYFFFRWRGWNGILIHLIAGGCLGPAAYLVYGPLIISSSQDYLETLLNRGLFYVPLGIILGMISSLSFWLIVRPDKIKTYRFWDET